MKSSYICRQITTIRTLKNNMRKKLLYLLFAVLAFSACNKENEANDNSDNTQTVNPVNYSELFQDALCTKLKSGINEKTIAACSDTTFRKAAMEMLKGTYQTEYRIAEFKAYPNPQLQASSNKTTPYSLLDNPTGISVSTGSNLIVMVDNTYGYKINLRIQNLNSEKDGYGGDSYPLSAGLNRISVKKGGLVYVIYQTSTLDDSNALPVKMHFVSANVNGYYELNKDRGNWNAKINKATDKYFDVVGNYAHLTFETADLKKYDGEQLIQAFDSIVHHEQIFLGLKKYNKMFRNRMYLNVMYTDGAWMYSTSYHTAYHKNTMTALCNPTKLLTSDCWGPAHEIGHSNQTRPGLKWLGTTEVTTNIMSEYIQTTVFGQPSRIQTEDMGKNYRNRYSKAWNSIVVAQSPISRFQSIGDGAEVYSSDVFCKLVPFWQLQLYFGNALEKTPLQTKDFGGFYPDVYEYIRTHANLSTPGEQQTEFVYICSLISGYNLIDFFTKWGFLSPINITVNDYGTGTMEVTQTRIDEIKNRINALNLPKPDVALEYISDATWKLYQKKPEVIKGSSSRNGNRITLSGWQNAVAYEITDANKKLLFVSSGINTASSTAWFELPFEWNNTYKIFAVAANGNRTEIVLN